MKIADRPVGNEGDCRPMRFSGLYIRATLQSADQAEVPGIQSIEEEREWDEAEWDRLPEARQYQTLGGSEGPAESETERLERILPTGEQGAGASGGR
ncbi:hypothetical protein SBA3_980021 [Candidatus Sulfopaludibacter sp. SbA3]|nr:hypothetical protein SBA3_980021 [Candidatus Sulfopaludibacter sp. SbA3]